MGTSFNVVCEECDYNKEFKIGIGMMFSPHRILDFNSELCFISYLIRSKKEVEYIKYLVKDKKATLTDGYGYDMYICPKCGELYSRFFMHLDFEDGSCEINYKCTKCKQKLIIVDKEINDDEYEINLFKIRCPKCGKFSLTKGVSYILWD